MVQSQAQEALQQGDYTLAAKNYIEGNGLPQERKQLTDLFVQVNSLNEAQPNPDLCAILGLIALDDNSAFNLDREEALLQCIQWSRQGLQIDPNHGHCYRNAGSALYWLDDWEAAALYYKKADELVPSPVLKIRLFNMANRGVEQPDFSDLQFNIETDRAMEAYNAGVELNYLLEGHVMMPDAERQRLTILKQECYAHAYTLYRGALIGQNGDLINVDPLTFAMCCNNLATEAILQGEYEWAIAITTEGMEYHVFPYILQNRLHAFCEVDRPMEAIADGQRLLDDFEEELDLLTYFNVVDKLCAAHMAIKQYEDLLEWVNIGVQVYYSLDATDPMTHDQEVVRCFTNFFIYKANAENALGIKYEIESVAQDTDELLEKMPDNPSLLISRANTFIDAGDFDKALECYQYAIHFATEKEMLRSVQVAFYNMGYMQVAHLHDITTAFESFEQSIAAGNPDFWCYYWAAHCAYHLQENEGTIYYAQSALQKLQIQGGVAHDIIAELYEHLGVAQLDLECYDEAIDNLTRALQYNDTKTTRENLKIAQIHKTPTKTFLGKLFGK